MTITKIKINTNNKVISIVDIELIKKKMSDFKIVSMQIL